MPNFIGKERFLFQSINKLPSTLRVILGWCSLCSYFNETVLQEILLSIQPNIKFSYQLWHWLVDLEITQKLAVGDDFYQIKPSYRKLFHKYISNRSSRYELVKIFEKCAQREIDPQHLSLYRAGKIVHQACSTPSDVAVETIADILNIFRYEESVSREILAVLSSRLPDKKVYRIYQAAAAIPRRENIDVIVIFPAAILIERIASHIRPRKFSVFPLYISSLVYQTWSNHEKSVETLKLAISHLPDETSQSSGVLVSRLALSYIMLGNMSKAQEALLHAEKNLISNRNEWIDNQLNYQIWYIKRGYWQAALTIGLSLEECIKDPYLKAKHTHILGVNYLYVGNFKRAEEYARKCEELSSLVSLSSWVIGKSWRNRFAYALLSTIDLVNGSNKVSNERKLYFSKAKSTSYDAIRQLNPLFRLILGCTVESHFLYTKAAIDAIEGNYLEAELKYLQLQQDKHLEVYYRISSGLDLATIYLRTNRIKEAIDLYRYCGKKAFESGFKYLEIRALRKVCELDFDGSLAERRDSLHRDSYVIGSACIDNLEFLIPV